MSEIEPIAQGLYDKLKNRFGEIAISDESAKPTSTIEDGRFFNFDFKLGSKNYGNVTISINDGDSLKVFFNRRISKKMDEEDRPSWYKFLKALRSFSRRNMLRFDTRDITRSALTKKEIKDMATNVDVYDKSELNQVTTESKLYGSKKSSYQKMVAREGQNPVKIIVRHAKNIDEEKHGARARNISAVFLETQSGERFKLPFIKLVGARAMARHLMNGGGVGDELGTHIVELVEEMGDLGQFVRLMKNKPWENRETKEMMEASVDRYQGVRATLNSLTGPKGYSKFAEAFNPQVKELDEFNADTVKEKFIQQSFPEKLESALPHVYSAHKVWSKNMSEQLQQVHEFVRSDESVQLGKTHGNKAYFESIRFVDTKALLRTVLEQVSDQADGAIKEFATKWASRLNTIEEQVDESLKEEYGMAVQLAKQYIKGVKSIKGGHVAEGSNNDIEELFNDWMNSEYAPFDDDSGDDNAVFTKALNFVADRMDNRSDSESYAYKLADMFQGVKGKGSDLDEYADWADSVIEEGDEVDEDAIRELVLYIENDGQLYQQQGDPIMRNLTKKWDKGVYDHDKAKTLWKYYADTGAKKYGKDHSVNDGFKMFSPAVRRAVASELADNWHEELKAGNKMEGAGDAPAGYDPHKDPVLTQTPAYKMSMGIQKGLQSGKKLFNKFRQGLADKIAPANKQNEEQGVSEGPNDGKEDNFTIDDIKNLERIQDLDTLKAQAKILVKGKPARRMKPEKISWFYNHIDTLKNPLAVIKMMYDLLLAGEGHKVIGSKHSTSPNSYRTRFGEQNVAEAEDHVELQKLIGQHLPVGQDGSNAITALTGIIDNEELNAGLQDIADKQGSDSCGRPAVYKYLQDANPELLKLLDFGDMTMENLGGDASEEFINSVTDQKKKKHGETTAEDLKRLSGLI